MLTVEERAHIESAAAASGLSVSEFVRRRSLGYRMPVSRSAEQGRDLLATALLRLGVNLNQIAKHMNAGRAAPDHLSELIAVIDEHVARLSR